MNQPILLIDGNRGIYAPKKFAEIYGPSLAPSGDNLSRDAWATQCGEISDNVDILVKGPDDEDGNYWLAWDDLTMAEPIITGLNNGLNTGVRYYLGYLPGQDSGDIWAIPEGYEQEEE